MDKREKRETQSRLKNYVERDRWTNVKRERHRVD